MKFRSTTIRTRRRPLMILAAVLSVLLLLSPSSSLPYASAIAQADGRTCAADDFPYRRDPHWRQETFPGLLNHDPEEFQKLFRLTPTSFKYVYSKIEHHLQPRDTGKLRNNRTYVEPIAKLGVLVYFLAQNPTLKACGTQWGVSKPTVSRILRKTASSIKRELYNEHVKWPDEAQQVENAKLFELCRYIPNILAVADGTHIPVKCAAEVTSSYLNRKGWTSLNVMALCDARMRFVYVVSGAPGCVHDARVWKNSPLHSALELNQKKLPGYFVVGDAAYPTTSYMITGYDVENTPRRVNFGFHLSSVRMVIERCFGKFKSQWRLFGVNAPKFYPNEMTRLLLAAVVLHNITIDIDGAGWHPSYKLDPANKICIDAEHDISPLTRTEEDLQRDGYALRDQIADSLQISHGMRSTRLEAPSELRVSVLCCAVCALCV